MLQIVKTMNKKLIASLLTFSLVASSAVAQVDLEDKPAEVAQGNFLGISIPLRDLEVIADESVPDTHSEGDVKTNRKRPEAVNPNALPLDGVDPIRQSTFGTRLNKEPLVNFTGNSGSFPPDPSGAAGPDHYVQAVNTRYKVYDKTGAALTGALNLSTLWAGSTNSGDPIVMYDRHADRWVITQFQTGSNEILLAISTTPDPTDTYYTYAFSFPSFPDYPKYSIWSDGYYMTSNTNTQNAVIFEREKMLVGDPTAQMVSKNLPAQGTDYGFRSVLPADADGDLPPYGTPCPMFLFEDDAYAGASQDRIRVMEYSVDWTNPSAATLAYTQSIPVSAFDAVFAGSSWNDIEQPGTSQRLDAIASIFNYRAQYIRWPGYNTLMLCNAVDVGGMVSGIRWYELHQGTDGNDPNWTVFQEGTYAPADGNSRFIGSISKDFNGHVGLAYSICGPSTFAGLAYTGRLNWDAPGEMTFVEQVAVNGQAAQNGGNRYGDYAQMTLDPDGETFWFTGEYLGTGGSRRTQIFSFNLQQQVGLEDARAEDLEFILTQDPSAINVSVDGLAIEGDIMVDIFDIAGKQLASNKVANTAGSFKTSFDKGNLASGTYIVRIGTESFQRSEKIVVSK